MVLVSFFPQDTNPIFLFSKEAIEAANPPSSKGVEETDKLKLQVEGLKNMPASMNAVVSRTQLALVRLCFVNFTS